MIVTSARPNDLFQNMTAQFSPFLQLSKIMLPKPRGMGCFLRQSFNKARSSIFWRCSIHPFGDSVSNGSAILRDVEWQVNERKSLDLFTLWEKEGKKGLLFRVCRHLLTHIINRFSRPFLGHLCLSQDKSDPRSTKDVFPLRSRCRPLFLAIANVYPFLPHRANPLLQEELSTWLHYYPHSRCYPWQRQRHAHTPPSRRKQCSRKVSVKQNPKISR